MSASQSEFALDERRSGVSAARSRGLVRHPGDSPLNLAILGSRGFPSTYGGYETLVRHVARHWTQVGHKVTVYCRAPKDGRRTWFVDGVRCVWTPGNDTKSASTLSFGASSHLHAAFQGLDAALVLNIANGFFLPILSARGIPSVVNTDGLEWERGKWGRGARRLFLEGARWSARHADVLVSDSEAIADVWQSQFGTRPRFIPYGAPVPPTVDDARVRKLGLQPRSYVLCVARLIPENNVDLTLDALELLSERAPAVVVGSANYDSPLESRLRDLDQAGSIRWLGHVHDQDTLGQLWAHCGAYVHGHSVGGTNPSLLQALGLGAPTLALDTPFNREVLRRHDQVYPHDPHALATRIESLLSDHTKQAAWAAHGRATISERYRWDAVCDAYERSLRDAMDLKGRSIR